MVPKYLPVSSLLVAILLLLVLMILTTTATALFVAAGIIATLPFIVGYLTFIVPERFRPHRWFIPFIIIGYTLIEIYFILFLLANTIGT